jgi:hypothetical protein
MANPRFEIPRCRSRAGTATSAPFLVSLPLSAVPWASLRAAFKAYFKAYIK